MTPSEKAEKYIDGVRKDGLVWDLGVGDRIALDAFLAGYAARHAEESKDA